MLKLKSKLLLALHLTLWPSLALVLAVKYEQINIDAPSQVSIAGALLGFAYVGYLFFLYFALQRKGMAGANRKPAPEYLRRA